MLSDLFGILKEGGDGVDARGRVEACDDCDDAAAAGRDDDCAGNPLAEGVAPITTALRRYMEAYKPIESDGAIEISRIGTIGYAGFIEHCDSIDVVHASLERDYKVSCEVNERQDEQYADMVHMLDRAYEKNRNQRRQLTEVQEALHRRNEGELKRRWMREKQDLELQIAKMRLESVELPKDADGEYIHVGDVLDGYGKTIEVVEMRHGRSGWVLISRDGNGYADTFAFTHHHAPTVEGVLRDFAQEMNENLGMYTGEAIDADEWRDADARTVEKFAAKLRLAESE